MADHRGVEGQRGARGGRRVARAVALAVVGVVTGRGDNPVVPADVLEVDVELPLAAQAGGAVALQATLVPPVAGRVRLPQHHHQEGPVGLLALSGVLAVCRREEGRGSGLGAQQAGHSQVEHTVASVQHRLDGVRHGERVPAAASGVQDLLGDRYLLRVPLGVGGAAGALLGPLEQPEGDLALGAVPLC